MTSASITVATPPITPALPGAITVTQAAQRLAVSTRTVRRWLNQGRLSALTSPDGSALLSSEAVDDLSRRGITDLTELL